MENNIEEWKNTAKILDFLGIKYEFEREGEKDYPFWKGLENIQFFTPYITIPQKGIEQVVLNKLSDEENIEERKKRSAVVFMNIAFFIICSSVPFRIASLYLPAAQAFQIPCQK